MPARSNPILQQLASEIRQLRLDAGNPTLHTMSKSTGLSRTVLSEALNGKQIPSENTLYRLARYFSVDAEVWLTRRREAVRSTLTRENQASSSPPTGTESEVDAPPPVEDKTQTAPRDERPTPIPDGSSGQGPVRFFERQVRVGTLMIVVAAAVVLTLAGSLTVQRIVDAGTPAIAEGTPPETTLEDGIPTPANGVDPMITDCRHDSVIAASEQRLDGDAQVQMLYSTSCMAVWGRITRYDEGANGNHVEMTVYPEGDPTSERAQSRRGDNLQSVYTPMLLEPDVDARVCGIATISVDGDTQELGPELCI